MYIKIKRENCYCCEKFKKLLKFAVMNDNIHLENESIQNKGNYLKQRVKSKKMN